MVRDTGMRNKKELSCARIEDIDWHNRVFFIPDSKTDNGRRFVPLSDRALELLKARCGDRREGWIFTAFSASGHLTTVDRKFRQARSEAGLPEKLVLYCGRHDYGTRSEEHTSELQSLRHLVCRLLLEKKKKKKKHIKEKKKKKKKKKKNKKKDNK